MVSALTPYHSESIVSLPKRRVFAGTEKESHLDDFTFVLVASLFTVLLIFKYAGVLSKRKQQKKFFYYIRQLSRK